VEIFSREAVTAIHECSQGLPRTINVVCDNALIGGFAAQVHPVPRSIVLEVMRDFDLRSTGAAPESPLLDTIDETDGTEAAPASEMIAPPEPAPEAGGVMFGGKRRRPFSFFSG
jgi:general secretion pathway protein A